MEQLSIFDLMKDTDYIKSCKSDYLAVLDSLGIYLVLYDVLVNDMIPRYLVTSEYFDAMHERLSNLEYLVCHRYDDTMKPFHEWSKDNFLKFYKCCPQAYKKALLERTGYRVYIEGYNQVKLL